MSTSLKRAAIAMVLFGVSFGYVEAAVVVYLRELSQPAVERAQPGRSPTDLFPLLSLEDLKANPPLFKTLEIELGREAATLIMIAALAVAIGQTGVERAAAFAATFGVWDLSFYAFLRWLIQWPSSLRTWDLLFLVPVPWAAPVLAPVIVSLSMIAAGEMVFARSSRGHPMRLDAFHWTGIMLGAAILVFSFTWRFPWLLGGGVPRHFDWLIFALGEAIGFGSFLHALKRKG